jgi:hypothetical protein
LLAWTKINENRNSPRNKNNAFLIIYAPTIFLQKDFFLGAGRLFPPGDKDSV